MFPFNFVLMQYNLNTAFVPLIVSEIETHSPLLIFRLGLLGSVI